MTKLFQKPSMVFSDVQLGYKCITITNPAVGTTFAQAPVIGIKITEQVDFSLAKTLSGNFNLVTFQDLPVVISLSGLRSLYTPCTNKDNIKSIAQLYNTIKASSTGTQSKLLDITIGKQAYKGTIVALSQQSSNIPGILTVSLTIFGTRQK